MMLITSGMGRDQIVCEIDVLAHVGLDTVEHLLEFQQRITGRLTHHLQDVIGDVFRCDLHLSGHVSVGDQFPQILLPVLLVRKDQIVPDAGCDENLLHTLDGGYPSEKVDLS